MDEIGYGLFMANRTMLVAAIGHATKQQAAASFSITVTS